MVSNMLRFWSRLLIVSVVFLTASTIRAAHSPVMPHELHGSRYCTVIPVGHDGASLRATVYNTAGFGDCPADLWQALDPATLTGPLGAVEVLLEGPRYWAADSMEATEPDKIAPIRNIGGMVMAARSTYDVPPETGSAARSAYRERTIHSHTVLSFDAQSRVYELIAPHGDTFVMQTWSQAIDPALRETDLAWLGARLTLPPGWAYRTRTLSAPLRLVAGGTSTVMRDNFGNTYQRVDTPVSAPATTATVSLALDRKSAFDLEL